MTSFFPRKIVIYAQIALYEYAHLQGDLCTMILLSHANEVEWNCMPFSKNTMLYIYKM